MNLKKIALSAAAGAALLAAAPAFADPPPWAPAHGWRAHQPHHYYYRDYYRAPAYAYRAPAYTYQAPAYVHVPARPVYVAPPYYSYAPPAPVIYGQIPVSPDLNVGFRVRF